MNGDRLNGSESVGRWANTQFLEFEDRGIRGTNQIPGVGGPLFGRDNRYHVPKDVEIFFRNRYGSNVGVVVRNPHGENDGSGYSYGVNSSQGVPVAEMEAVRTVILMLPEGYEGPLVGDLLEV